MIQPGYRIPLIGKSLLDRKVVDRRSPLGHALAGTLDHNDIRNLLMLWDRKTRHMAVIKPERSLGAPWIDDFVSQGKGVNLCHDCRNRYRDWYKKFDYHPRHSPVLSDCDGCSELRKLCILYSKRLS